MVWADVAHALSATDLHSHRAPRTAHHTPHTADLGESHADLLPADAQALLLDASVAGSLEMVERALVAGANTEAAGTVNFTSTRSIPSRLLILMYPCSRSRSLAHLQWRTR